MLALIKGQIVEFLQSMKPLMRLVLAMLVSLILTLVVVSMTEKIVMNKAAQQFNEDSERMKVAIDSSINRYKDLLFSISSLIVTNKSLSEFQFEKFTSSIALDEKYPAIHMIDFTEKVSQKNVNKFYLNLEKEYSQEDMDFYKNNISKYLEENKLNSNKKNDLQIVKYVYPIDTAYPYVGLDLSQNFLVTKIIEDSFKSKLPSSSGKVYFSKKDNAYPFISLRLATFQDSEKNSDIENYMGSVGVSVKLDKSLFGSLSRHLEYMSFQIYSPKEEGRSLLYDSRFSRKNVDIPWSKELFDDTHNLFIGENEFVIGHRQFLLKTFSTVLPPNVATMSVVWIIGVVSFIVFFFILFYGLMRRFDYHVKYEKEKQNSKYLKTQAYSDDLTGLFNRRAFFNDLDKQIKKNVNDRLFIFFVDLDGFKRINDTVGHSFGDSVLVEYSNRLKNLNEGFHFNCYRIGGDEFAVIIEENKLIRKLSHEDVENFATTIQKITELPFNIKDENYYLSQSMGITEYPNDGSSPEELFKNSDIAMYEAKKNGKNRHVFFAKHLAEKLTRKNIMLHLLLGAIERNEFYLLYQPKMERRQGKYRIKGVEALIRWNNEKLGLVNPLDFINLAEESGYISDIGKWLINEISKTLSIWKKEKINIPISINISAKQLNNEKLADEYYDVLTKFDILPDKVIIEITESTMMIEPEKTKQLLSKFRAYGFGISVDDFGTGYSSLSYLHQFPVTEIKIDKSFTDKVLEDSQNAIIVEGIINISKELKLDIVIEGVESQEQVDWIEKRLGNNISVQGYYFSSPLKSDNSILDFINKNY